MNGKLLFNSLRGFKESISVEEFQKLTKIPNHNLDELLCYLKQNGIGYFSEDHIEFSISDKVKTAVLAISFGITMEECSRLLNWRDFEFFVYEILKNFGYKAKINLHLTKPHLQIDVIGEKQDFALLIDCKHWKYDNISSLNVYAKKQKIRTNFFLKKNRKILFGIPVIVTLHSKIKNAEGVHVVSIDKFRSFLNEFDFLDYGYRIYRENP